MGTKMFEISFGLAFVGFIILFYVRWFKSDKFTILTAIGAILFVQVFLFALISIASNSIHQKDARNLLKSFLLKKELVIMVNDHKLDSIEIKKLKLNFQSMNKNYHHSYPMDSIKLKLSTHNKEMNLILRKDSEVENEYWVYWPSFTKDDELGLIKINIDEINAR